ncbi:MAG: glycosyltransferase [Bacteroidetes bacterium]|nr:MAG: glycosyltransferase [Bacteroidota bacterium]
MSKKRAIIIFQKNAVKGRVKTRLAAGVGDEKALEIYRFLTAHAHQQLRELNVDKFLFFSDYLEEIPELKNYHFRVQQGADLGERMYRAFSELFEVGYESILIIGTDCYELRSKHLSEAFEQLRQSSFVFGPAKDGGYYLLGTTELLSGLFLNKNWSHEHVLKDACDFLEKNEQPYQLLETLSDVDTIDDLGPLKEQFQIVSS